MNFVCPVHLTLSNVADARQKIEKAICKHIDDTLYKVQVRQDVLDETRLIIDRYLKEQPEYASLMDEYGTLRTEMGIVDNQSNVQAIIDIWLKNILVNFYRVQGELFRCQIRAIQTDFADVLQSPASYYETEKGTVINWLSWLLLEGDNIIVRDYDVKWWPRSSRTSSYIMVNYKSGGWRVPPQFSGKIDNNWTTRAIDMAWPDIKQVFITKILMRV